MKNIIKRAKEPTPKFFRILRNTGLLAAAIGGALMSAEVVLPKWMSDIAGYLLLAGGVISAVCQMTVKNDSDQWNEDDKRHTATENNEEYES